MPTHRADGQRQQTEPSWPGQPSAVDVQVQLSAREGGLNDLDCPAQRLECVSVELDQLEQGLPIAVRQDTLSASPTFVSNRAKQDGLLDAAQKHQELTDAEVHHNMDGFATHAQV